MCVLIIFCLTITTFVTSEMQVHRVFVSRKSRSESVPVKTSFTYKQVNNPGTSSFGSDWTASEPILENYSELRRAYPIQYHPIDFSKQIFRPYESSLSKRDLDSMKAESKYTHFLPSKVNTDIMYERLKSAMDYRMPDDANEMISRYDSNEYHTDDDDTRTGSRGVYDNWPSYHNNPSYHYNPYEYLKLDTEVEKAKDKRYVADSTKVIPIHEDLTDDIPNPYVYAFTTEYYPEQVTDNPMTGHDPFFEFVLNDYFDKKNDDDHLLFKGVNWGSDFDMDDNSRRNRHLENSYQAPDDHETTDSHLHHEIEALHRDSVTEKGINEKHNLSKHEKGDREKSNEKSKYKQIDHKHTGFKDFVNSFANKFGSGDDTKASQYVLKRNQDNGEKRKGFHRVYHKDEYQEDKEFYNNNNNSAKAEEKGSANAHTEGSAGRLSSHAAISLGNRSDTTNNAGDTEKSIFESNHTGQNNNNDFVGYFNKYRDVAKQTALSNNADYSDHYFR